MQPFADTCAPKARGARKVAFSAQRVQPFADIVRFEGLRLRAGKAALSAKCAQPLADMARVEKARRAGKVTFLVARARPFGDIVPAEGAEGR